MELIVVTGIFICATAVSYLLGEALQKQKQGKTEKSLKKVEVKNYDGEKIEVVLSDTEKSVKDIIQFSADFAKEFSIQQRISPIDMTRLAVLLAECIAEKQRIELIPQIHEDIMSGIMVALSQIPKKEVGIEQE